MPQNETRYMIKGSGILLLIGGTIVFTAFGVHTLVSSFSFSTSLPDNTNPNDLIINDVVNNIAGYIVSIGAIVLGLVFVTFGHYYKNLRDEILENSR